MSCFTATKVEFPFDSLLQCGHASVVHVRCRESYVAQAWRSEGANVGGIECNRKATQLRNIPIRQDRLIDRRSGLPRRDQALCQLGQPGSNTLEPNAHAMECIVGEQRR